MLAQVFWDPAKGCSHAVLALFLFSKTGQKRQARPCSSSLGNSLRTTKRGDVPWGQHDRPSGTPHRPHTFLSHAKRSAHLSVCSSFLFWLLKPRKGRTSLTKRAPPAPALPTTSQQSCSWYHPPASSAPPRAGLGFDLTARFSANACSFRGGQFKQETLVFVFVHAKSENFHTEDGNRVVFGFLPKSYNVFPSWALPSNEKASLHRSIRTHSCQYLHMHLNLLRSAVLSQRSLGSQTSRML